jgi:methionyl-tRNA formyltransferase
MRYVYLANGRVACELLRWLVARGDGPAGLVVHAPEDGRSRQEIIDAAGLPPEHVRDAPDLRTPAGRRWLAAHEPDWLVSVYFGHILKPDILEIPARGALNLHPALLPYNRGANTNVWSIVDRTPAGVTLHRINAGVDTGDIVAQREVAVEPSDTGASLYARLEDAGIALFKETWPLIGAGTFASCPQPEGGTSHRRAELQRIDRIDPDRLVRAGDLIDLLRARTFPPHNGAYLDLGDRRVYLRLELTEERCEPA